GASLTPGGTGQEPAIDWGDLASRPGAVEALNGLGNALQGLHRCEDALPAYDQALVLRPDHAEVLYNRGNALLELGRADEAAASYRSAITLDPMHAQAHYNLGNALQLQHRRREAIVHYERAIALRPGFVEAINNMGIAFETLHEYEPAMTCFRAALGLQPQHLAAHHNLGNTLQLLDRLPEARAHLDAALRLDGRNAQVQRSLAVLCLREGQREQARRHARLGFPGGIEARPARGSLRSPLRVLVLLSALGGNLAIDELLEQASCTRLTVTVEFWEAGSDVPPHDVIFNAIGEADRCAEALREAGGIIAASGRPLINPPERVLATGRLENAERLGRLAGVVAPRMRRYPRAQLLGRAAAAMLERDGLGWPLLLRTPGFHTGEHFVKVDAPLGLARAVAQLPGAELVAMQFLEARGSDGNVRKYRVMMVAGQLLPLHLAISTRWMVHYFNADMGEARHEAEEAAFLSDMPGTLGPDVMAALGRIAAVVDLDYGGIDFGLDAAGHVLLFEANATMVVPPPQTEQRFHYRQPAADRVCQAVRELVLGRAGVAAG
ncbi:MAG: tetratricopeptide repeat protein, partial [Chloroflexota bacterium]